MRTTVLALLSSIFLVPSGVKQNPCNPDDERGIGCIVSVTVGAKHDPGTTGSFTSIGPFELSRSRSAGIQIRSGDSFWLSQGGSAKIVYYYLRKGGSADPVTMSGPTYEQPRVWFREADGRQYSEEEMARLRRRLRLAAAPKAAYKAEIVLPASGDVVWDRQLVVVARTGDEGVRTGLLSAKGQTGWGPVAEFADAKWSVGDGVTKPTVLELSRAEFSKIGPSGDVKLVLGVGAGVMERTFRLRKGSMDDEFTREASRLLGSRDAASFESLADSLQRAIARSSASAVASNVLLLAKHRGGILKGRLVETQPHLVQAVEDLFLEVGFKEEEIWPLLARP